MKKNNEKSLKERFFDLKRDKSITLGMVGEKAGVSGPTVGRVINGLVVPLQPTHKQITDALEHFERLSFKQIHGGLAVKRAPYGSKKGGV
jgi:predicted transcriptional regulator